MQRRLACGEIEDDEFQSDPTVATVLNAPDYWEYYYKRVDAMRAAWAKTDLWQKLWPVSLEEREVARHFYHDLLGFPYRGSSAPAPGQDLAFSHWDSYDWFGFGVVGIERRADREVRKLEFYSMDLGRGARIEEKLKAHGFLFENLSFDGSPAGNALRFHDPFNNEIWIYSAHPFKFIVAYERDIQE